MATSEARIETEQGTPTGDTHSAQTPQSSFDERDHRLARKRYPRLYYQITEEHVSFDHIAKAWGISHDPHKPTTDDDMGVSHFLEFLARRKFSEEHGRIEREYWIDEPLAGCALTADGWVHSVMNIADAELVSYEDLVHQLCRDAHRAFESSARRHAETRRDLLEVGEMLYTVLNRLVVTASILKDVHATQHERDEQLIAFRIRWRTIAASVKGMIRRQARFQYLAGVGLGALITIPALAVTGWAVTRHGTKFFGEPGAFTAAIIGGAVGAVISVTQRMTPKTLVLDFSVRKYQQIILGALRPIVGAIFAALVYFAFIAGFIAVDAKVNKETSTALAFFAVAGFAAGFSERLATDVVDRAFPTTRAQQRVEDSGEPSVLLSEQPRHARTPTVTQGRQEILGGEDTGPHEPT
jgi:hypothetical protein